MIPVAAGPYETGGVMKADLRRIGIGAPLTPTTAWRSAERAEAKARTLSAQGKARYHVAWVPEVEPAETAEPQNVVESGGRAVLWLLRLVDSTAWPKPESVVPWGVASSEAALRSAASAEVSRAGAYVTNVVRWHRSADDRTS